MRGGALETLEGDWAPKRLTMLRFDSVARAKAWFDSPTYRAARELRAGLTARFDMVVVDGVAA